MSAVSPDLEARQAYRDRVRALYKLQHVAGFVACLVGALTLVFGRMVAAAPDWVAMAGLLTIAAGWLLFAYVLVRRTRYVRAHPFDPQS